MKEPSGTGNPSKPASITRQVLILLFSGLLLSAGSCAGFFGTATGSNPVAFVFAVGFAAGVVMMFCAVVWAVIRAASGD
jgi:hypothetical protein